MIKLLKLAKNQSGMSLAQVMIAMGLTGVLSIILMNLAEQQTKQQKSAMIAGETTEIFAQFVRIINTKASCEASFAGLKKGDSLVEIRYKFDDNEEPFAEVGKFFRGTKLKLKSMTLQTDTRYGETHKNDDGTPKTPPTKNNAGQTVVTLEITLEKPTKTLGGTNVMKIFDVPVTMGKGDLIKMPTTTAVETECTNTTGGDGVIVDFSTGAACPPPTAASCMEGGGGFYFGMCVDPHPPDSADDVILGCTSL